MIHELNEKRGEFVGDISKIKDFSELRWFCIKNINLYANL